MNEIALKIFVVVCSLTAIFHVLVAFGLPWGRFTQGGQHDGRLPTRGRVTAVASAIILVLFIIVALTRSGRILLDYTNVSHTAMWVVTAYMALGVVLNAISRSKAERNLWTPVVLILLLCSLVLSTN
ncbi:MAG TPA: hypothetical protein PLW14_06530 [Chlorobiota bacterium]|nr:hypothetical protein [Chlorobiota bacterium]